MKPIKRWYLTMAYAANVQMVRLSLRNSRGCRPGSIGRIGALRDARVGAELAREQWHYLQGGGRLSRLGIAADS